MSLRLFFNMLVTPTGWGAGGEDPEPDPDPAGSPYDLNAPNDGMNFSIAWTDSVAQQVNLFRDDVYYATIDAGVQIKAIGAMFGDGTHTWKAQHIDPDSDFSTAITTVDGIIGGGGGPSGDPSGLSVYEFGGGSKFGIQWTNGDATSETAVERDSVEIILVTAGGSNYDVGLKAGDGTAAWRVRHYKNGVYSGYSATVTTVEGLET